MNTQSYRDLQIWQKSRALVADIYRLSQTFPKHEQYGLYSQIQRAAVSTPSNIAELRTPNSEFSYATQN